MLKIIIILHLDFYKVFMKLLHLYLLPFHLSPFKLHSIPNNSITKIYEMVSCITLLFKPRSLPLQVYSLPSEPPGKPQDYLVLLICFFHNLPYDHPSRLISFLYLNQTNHYYKFCQDFGWAITPLFNLFSKYRNFSTMSIS